MFCPATNGFADVLSGAWVETLILVNCSFVLNVLAQSVFRRLQISSIISTFPGANSTCENIPQTEMTGLDIRDT
jgi:hypothetical protein